jgi:hypothetical protein
MMMVAMMAVIMAAAVLSMAIIMVTLPCKGVKEVFDAQRQYFNIFTRPYPPAWLSVAGVPTIIVSA